MRTNAWGLVEDHYQTFVNTDLETVEKHWPRVVLQAIVSILIAIFLKPFSEGSISVVVTTLSILAGFSFSAMFPIASDIRSGLPKSEYAEDSDDLARLSILSSYFRANVSYFIPLTLICIVIYLFMLVDFYIPEFVVSRLQGLGDSFVRICSLGSAVSSFFAKVLQGLSAFLLMEVLYTFYRMCFSVLYILRIKEEYRLGHEEK
jgi:hypothetical protein